MNASRKAGRLCGLLPCGRARVTPLAALLLPARTPQSGAKAQKRKLAGDTAQDQGRQSQASSPFPSPPPPRGPSPTGLCFHPVHPQSPHPGHPAATGTKASLPAARDVEERNQNKTNPNFRRCRDMKAARGPSATGGFQPVVGPKALNEATQPQRRGERVAGGVQRGSWRRGRGAASAGRRPKRREGRDGEHRPGKAGVQGQGEGRRAARVYCNPSRDPLEDLAQAAAEVTALERFLPLRLR